MTPALVSINMWLIFPGVLVNLITIQFFLITKNKTFVDVGGKVSVFSDPALRFRSATQRENYIVHPDISQVVGSNSKDQFVGAGEVDG